MARGTQLIQLVKDLRAEIGDSTSVASGVDFEENLKTTLRRTQEFLYEDYDWPHLNVITSKSLAAGQRYYDMPSGLNFDHISNVAVLWGGVYHPIDRGIGWSEYSVHDSASDERSSPVQRWEVRYTGSTDQIEVWPIPNDNDQTLYFEGIQDLPPLTSNSDTAVLDDVLIVLFAAAEYLARQGSKDANAKLSAAQDRYAKVKARMTAGAPTIQMGLKRRDNGLHGRTVVRVT